MSKADETMRGVKQPGRKRPVKKLTPNENHLLRLVALLRGSAHDGWARLRMIASKKAPIEQEADLDEILEHERLLGTAEYGAGLPPSHPERLPKEWHDLVSAGPKTLNAHRIKVTKQLKKEGRWP